ncbi:MAG: hypothetical protein ABW321_21950, partial [Polyangiales bacterium]
MASLLDRSKRAAEEPDPVAHAAAQRASDKPVELAAEEVERASLRAGVYRSRPPDGPTFLQQGGLRMSLPPQASSQRPRAGSGGRIAYGIGISSGCVLAVAAIGSTGSALAGGVAVAIVAASALAVVLERPPSVRAFYARHPGSAIAAHVAVLVGALVAWGDVPYRIERLQLQAAARSSEAGDETDKPTRAALEGRAADVTKQLRELAAQARAAADVQDWRKAAELLARAVVVQQPDKDAAALVVID